MDRTNKDRANAAFEQVEGYGENWKWETWPGPDMSAEDQAMLAQQMSDLLCDMHHLADLAELSWERLLERGDYHYQAEVAEDD